MKRLKWILIGLVVWVVLLPLIVELGGRILRVDFDMVNAALYWQGSQPSLYQESDDWILHYELKPGQSLESAGPYGQWKATVGELGTRGASGPLLKPPDTFRILAFGSSTLFGDGVNDDATLPAALQSTLNHLRETHISSAPRFEVWNFGHSAYTLSQEARLARVKLEQLSPDLVLMVFPSMTRRPFLGQRGGQQTDIYHWAKHDPLFFHENFPPPPGAPVKHHYKLMQMSSFYRFWVARQRILPAEGQFQGPGADLCRQMTAELHAAGQAAGVPVRYVIMSPNLMPHGLVPEPESALSLYPQSNPPGAEAHPNAQVLATWAKLLADQLIQFRLVPLDSAPVQ